MTAALTISPDRLLPADPATRTIARSLLGGRLPLTVVSASRRTVAVP